MYIESVFSPNGHCEESIIKTLKEAKQTIRIQMYAFNNYTIFNTLKYMKNRGIDIKIILDEEQSFSKNSRFMDFAKNGFQIKTDQNFPCSHNKITIIDNKTIIVGSYNYTFQAEKYNSENILILKNNTELAQRYLENFAWHWENI